VRGDPPRALVEAARCRPGDRLTELSRVSGAMRSRKLSRKHTTPKRTERRDGPDQPICPNCRLFAAKAKHREALERI
jgi:hypothetical protein